MPLWEEWTFVHLIFYLLPRCCQQLQGLFASKRISSHKEMLFLNDYFTYKLYPFVFRKSKSKYKWSTCRVEHSLLLFHTCRFMQLRKQTSLFSVVLYFTSMKNTVKTFIGLNNNDSDLIVWQANQKISSNCFMNNLSNINAVCML